jgi:hypothetical protein
MKKSNFVMVVIGILIGLVLIVSVLYYSLDGGGLIACTKEAKICPDGTAVGRSGIGCEFDPCPSGDGTQRNYVSTDIGECQRTQFLCVSGTDRFDDETGCGCESVGEKTFCEPEEREEGACITLYQPVCGWNDPEKINCIRFPCAQTYSNGCVACQNEEVLYYTEGECPA